MFKKELFKLASIMLIVCTGFISSCHKSNAPLEEVKKSVPEAKEEQQQGQQSDDKALLSINKTDVKKIVIKMYEGHLHGDNFHYVPGPQNIPSPHIRLERELTFVYKNNKWQVPEGQINKFILFNERIFGCWIYYYNEAGELINGDFAGGEEYQTFFIPKDVKAIEGIDIAKEKLNAPKLLEYSYRDTNPWDRSGSNEGARFIYKDNPLGLKGFFKFPVLNTTFKLSLQLWKMNGTKLNGGKPAPFYAPNTETKSKGEKVLELNIPMFILLAEQDRSLSEDNKDKAKTLDDAIANKVGFLSYRYTEQDRARMAVLLKESALTWEEFVENLVAFFEGEWGGESEGHWF